jgi:hypothetical protein
VPSHSVKLVYFGKTTLNLVNVSKKALPGSDEICVLYAKKQRPIQVFIAWGRLRRQPVPKSLAQKSSMIIPKKRVCRNGEGADLKHISRRMNKYPEVFRESHRGETHSG